MDNGHVLSVLVHRRCVLKAIPVTLRMGAIRVCVQMANGRVLSALVRRRCVRMGILVKLRMGVIPAPA